MLGFKPLPVEVVMPVDPQVLALNKSYLGIHLASSLVTLMGTLLIRVKV